MQIADNGLVLEPKLKERENMKAPLSLAIRLSAGVSSALIFCALSTTAAKGQDNPTIHLPAPPPIKFVSRQEQAELSAEPDPKTRVRIILEMADSHLRHAEEMVPAKRYDEALTELANYQGIVEYSLHFLGQVNDDSKRIRDLLRKLELTLRSHGPRIEAIRRVTPSEYAIYIKAIADFSRSARAQALNAFYGDTVVRGEAFREEQKPSNDSDSRNQSSHPKKKP
jgi:hypothetical protein